MIRNDYAATCKTAFILMGRQMLRLRLSQGNIAFTAFVATTFISDSHL